MFRRLASPIPAAATVVLVLVIHVAETEGDRRPNHQGELPFWQRTVASHATRGGHNSFDQELLLARGHGHHDATPIHDANDHKSLTNVTGETATKHQVQAMIMRTHALILDLVPLLRVHAAHDLDRP